ncbi:MAG: hypothetical protein BMS9Abin21_231 [Thermodesulfovibrionia bacterium]|nr:MAG: hypothetical protein BMS9Abin21_231 [Thermodesulfovibrionia bacterium]
MKLAAINFRELEEITIPRFVPPAPGTSSNPATIITNILPIVYSLSGIALLIYLVAGGYQYLTSGGEPGKIASARAKIMNALVGIIIVFTSYWIVQLIAIFLGLDRLRFVFPWSF